MKIADFFPSDSTIVESERAEPVITINRTSVSVKRNLYLGELEVLFGIKKTAIFAEHSVEHLFEFVSSYVIDSYLRCVDGS